MKKAAGQARRFPKLRRRVVAVSPERESRPIISRVVWRSLPLLGDLPARVLEVRTPRTALRIASLAALAVVVAALTAGWAGSSVAKSGVAGARHVTKSATVMTRKVRKLGVILVNSRGRTLYMFVPDRRKKVTCKASCAVIWPPLKIKTGHRPTAGGAAKQKLLGTDPNPGGGRVVTYNRWPLYTYITDHRAGQTTGQGVRNSGGLWYVLSPSGKVIKK